MFSFPYLLVEGFKDCRRFGKKEVQVDNGSMSSKS
jgi:hypothetical protein